MSGTVLSIMVLSALILLGAAIHLWRSRGVTRQAALMLVLAIVIAINVAIWTFPDSSGEAPLGRAPVE